MIKNWMSTQHTDVPYKTTKIPNFSRSRDFNIREVCFAIDPTVFIRKYTNIGTKQ